MSKLKVIVTRRWHADVEAVLSERYDTQLNQDDHPMSVAELQDALRNADAVLPTVSDKVTAEVLGIDGIRTKILGSNGVGFNHIDLDAAKAAGLTVTNTPEVLTDCTADLALEAAIEEALQRRQALQLEHQAMVADQSPSTAIRTRAFVLDLVGTLWVITPLVALRMGDDLAFFHGANACLLVLIGALAVWARESLGRSQVNRFLTGQLLAVPILQGVVLLLTDLQGGGRDEAVVTMMPAWAAMSMCNVALFGRVFLPLTLAFLGAAVVGTLRPAWALYALTVANAVLLVNALVPWAPQLYTALVEGRRERLARNEEAS